jgi:hypothetical protein
MRGVSVKHRSSFARFTCAAVVAAVGFLGVTAAPAFANKAHNKPHNTPAGPTGYAYAATENQRFTIKGIADVVYGANGKFNRKNGVTGTISCSNSVFGNPDKGVTKACFTLADVGPAAYTYEATEGGHVNIHGLADVAYGSQGKFNRKTGVTGSISCSNSVFGDPDVGVHKSCYVLPDIGPAGYTYAGTEGVHLTFSGLTDVAYGDRGKFNRKTGVSGGIDCTNTVFGNPDPGVQKQCYILPDVGPAGYTYAGTEGVHLSIVGIADVAYGDRGKFNRKTGVTGGIDCTNTVFGNPDPGVQKQCYILADNGPAGYSYAATENGSFAISGVADVAYGANGLFNIKLGLTGQVNCSNSTFSDPDVHVHKSCYVKPH